MTQSQASFKATICDKKLRHVLRNIKGGDSIRLSQHKKEIEIFEGGKEIIKMHLLVYFIDLIDHVVD